LNGTETRSVITLSSGGIDVQVAGRVDDVGEEAWDRLGNGLPFTSARWYRFGENALVNDRPMYVNVSYRGEAIGRATFWLTTDAPLPVGSSMIRRGLGILFRRWPLLVCRSPVADVSGLLLPADPSLRRGALEAIREAARELARQHNVSFVLMDYLLNAETKMDWPAGFVAAAAGDPGTRLSIAWPDFPSYLKGLRYSARHSYRINCNHARRLGIEVKIYRTVEALEEVLFLIRNVERHHNAAHIPWARQTLENISMVDGHWLAVELGGRLAACCVLLSDRRAGVLTLLGRNYQARYAYFQLLYAAMGCAIDTGLHSVKCGSGSYDLKRRLGFELEGNNQIMFAARNRVLYGLGRRLTSG
jgi:predicted N-acyltransferase